MCYLGILFVAVDSINHVYPLLQSILAFRELELIIFKWLWMLLWSAFLLNMDGNKKNLSFRHKAICKRNKWPLKN